MESRDEAEALSMCSVPLLGSHALLRLSGDEGWGDRAL